MNKEIDSIIMLPCSIDDDIKIENNILSLNYTCKDNDLILSVCLDVNEIRDNNHNITLEYIN